MYVPNRTCFSGVNFTHLFMEWNPPKRLGSIASSLSLLDFVHQACHYFYGDICYISYSWCSTQYSILNGQAVVGTSTLRAQKLNFLRSSTNCYPLTTWALLNIKVLQLLAASAEFTWQTAKGNFPYFTCVFLCGESLVLQLLLHQPSTTYQWTDMYRTNYWYSLKFSKIVPDAPPKKETILVSLLDF